MKYETSKTLLKEFLKESWYAQDQYTSNKSVAEIKFSETTSSKKIKLSELDNENISAGRIMIEIDFFSSIYCISSIILLHVFVLNFNVKKCNVNYETLSHGFHPTSLVWMCICFPKTKANIRHTEDSKKAINLPQSIHFL